MFKRKQAVIFTIFKLWVVLNIVCVDAVDHPQIDSHSFCYEKPECGPSKWSGVCNTGKAQSPIDIPSFSTYVTTKFSLNSNYLSVQQHKFYGQNNGHTAQFELIPRSSNLNSGLYLSGGKLNAKYSFAQLHFHWGKKDSTAGSEHTLKTVRYALELHMVHFNKKYSSLTTALGTKDPDAVLVMAVLFQIGVTDNARLKPIISALDSLQGVGKVTEFKMDLKMSSLYPISSQRRFARYLGSLTTPSCDEKVVWTVFVQPQTVSKAQMSKFYAIRDKEGVSSFNFRPIQKLNSRPISYYYTADFLLIKEEPEAEPYYNTARNYSIH